MEKITIKKLILILLFLPIIGFGQNFPQGINYQAIARDTNGSVMMNQALIIQFSIISDSTTSAISWQETHPVTTNNYGLFTAVIGQGTSTNIGSSTTFNLIDWGASNHLLKVEIDYGNGYVDMGITAFMSVPYSLSTKYADTALNIRGISNRDFSNDIPSNSPGWYCIATLNPIFAGENCRGLFSIWDNTSGIREQITFYAGVSYSRGAFLDVVSHNCYGTNSSIDSIKIQSSNSNFYDPVNIYIFRKNVVQTTKLSVSLNNYLSVPAESGLNIGEWKLTPNALPISSEKNLICDLTKTKGLEPYSYTTLNKNFQGSVSRSTAVLDDDDLTTKQYVDSIFDENVQHHSHIINNLSPYGWYLLAECDDLKSINASKPNMANTINSGLFNLNTTLNYETGGYNAANQFTTSIDFILSANYASSIDINVLNSSFSTKVFEGLYVFREGGKLKLYGHYTNIPLAANKEITCYSTLNNPKTLTDSTFQVNWKLIDFDFFSTPSGDSLFGYEISQELYQTKAINNTKGVIVKGNNLLFKESFKPFTENTYLAEINSLNQNISSPPYIALSANGRFKIKAKHSINGVTYFQEAVFDAIYSFSFNSDSIFTNNIDSSSTSSSLNLISNNMTKKLISKIQLVEINDISFLYPFNKWVYIKVVLDDNLTSLNEGLELSIYNNDKNSSWRGNNSSNSFSSSATNIISEEIDLTKEFPKFQEGLFTLDNSNSIINTLQTEVIIDASSPDTTTGGLKIINIDNPFSVPEISLIPPTMINGQHGVSSSWRTTIDGNTAFYGSNNLTLYSSKGQADFSYTRMEKGRLSLGLIQPGKHTVPIRITNPNTFNDTTYTEDWFISLNNGHDSTTNKVSTYINTPSYNINNDPRNPALHVDAITEEIKINAPLKIDNYAYSNFNPSEPMHIVNKHYVDSIQQVQVISFNTTGLAPDSWITIASVGPKTTQSQKQRADAEFEFTNNMSAAHQRITVRASHIYASGHNLDVIKNVKYGDGNRRQIKAFRIAYGNIYDGGLLQMQLGDNDPATSHVPINLRVLNNNNDYGWYIDSNLINNTVISDSLPIGYNDGTGNSLFLFGSFQFFPNFFPSDTGVNILDHTPYIGKSSLMYTSDMIHHGSVKRISPVENDNDLTTKQYVDNNKGKSIMPFYNMNLTGSSFYGGTGTSNSTNDNNYRRFESVFTTTFLTSYFGFGDYNVHSPIRPINSKFHTIEDIIVTGIYLNTPYIDVGTFSNSSAAGGLFGYGVNDYIDLEIGLPSGGTGYERIFRLGNPSSGDQDLYYFPSAGTMSLNPSGIKIVLPESDWILIPAGTNMATVLRFKYYVNDTLWIRNDYNGTLFNYSQINGYLMYITE